MKRSLISCLTISDKCAMIEGSAIERIKEITHRIIDPLGFDLVEAQCMRSGQNLNIRLLVDRIEGGITLEECTQLNRQIGAAFDEENIFSQSYVLEVCSPGLDRFLTSPKDFRRVLNQALMVFLKEEHGGRKQYDGMLTRIDNEGIYLTDKKNNEVHIPFIKIHKAKQVIV